MQSVEPWADIAKPRSLQRRSRSLRAMQQQSEQQQQLEQQQQSEQQRAAATAAGEGVAGGHGGESEAGGRVSAEREAVLAEISATAEPV